MLHSIFELFKVGIGPSSSHTNGPMIAAKLFVDSIDLQAFLATEARNGVEFKLSCVLTGSLAYTGIGHGSDTALLLGLNGYTPEKAAELCGKDHYASLISTLKDAKTITLEGGHTVQFDLSADLRLDTKKKFKEHPNGMIFKLHASTHRNAEPSLVCSETYFSVGGGFIKTIGQYSELESGQTGTPNTGPHTFSTAKELLKIVKDSKLSIAEVQLLNELNYRSKPEVERYIRTICTRMFSCLEDGLRKEGVLPGVLKLKRRAKILFNDLQLCADSGDNEYLCAYAMAVNEENASGSAVVTAPTNGAAGVIPAVLYYLYKHKNISDDDIQKFILTAAVVGGLIKSGSSISGAEVGCQGEIGAASAMAAAGSCAVMGGTPKQIENAAEIALEHHLGMTCDPVEGLVQVPCIERNGFGAIKAVVASSLALHGDGDHLISLDSCIAAMKQTGEEMSDKFKETSKGGLAVKWVDC